MSAIATSKPNVVPTRDQAQAAGGLPAPPGAATAASDERTLQRPALSIVMPCYDEEAIVGYTIPRLVTAFERAGYTLELVAVDNGSHDRTGEIIRSCAERHPSVVYHRVERNVGYGNGILSGLPLCTAPWVGMIPAD